MDAKTGAYHVVDLTPGRRIWINTLDAPSPKHAIYGLLEVDVTAAQQLISGHEERTGELLSFTGFLIYCLTCAVNENKEVQAYLKGRSQLILYDEVSVGMMIEHSDGGKKALMGHIIRGAERKTYREIHEEIRRVQAEPAPPNRGMPGWFRSAMLLPWPLINLVKAFLNTTIYRDPAVRAATSGTVMVTAVGMFGKGHSGWGITTSPHSLSLVVGSMAWKPAVVDGRIQPRQMLNLTLVFDHDVVDGAPAARFTSRLVELIERGHGLAEIVDR
jgi:pyruvate/2-oxoglutarate dehydrogenase complex dihydrolipoamide acyltransferase (E2) component